MRVDIFQKIVQLADDIELVEFKLNEVESFDANYQIKYAGAKNWNHNKKKRQRTSTGKEPNENTTTAEEKNGLMTTQKQFSSLFGKKKLHSFC